MVIFQELIFIKDFKVKYKIQGFTEKCDKLDRVVLVLYIEKNYGLILFEMIDNNLCFVKHETLI